MYHNNLDEEFSSLSRSNEEEHLQVEEESKEEQTESFLIKQKKKEEEEVELTQFFDGEDEEDEKENNEEIENENKNEIDDNDNDNDNNNNNNDILENLENSIEKKEDEEEEMENDSIKEFFEDNEIKDQSDNVINKEITKEIFERGESEGNSESDDEIVNIKKFKKNKMKKRKLEENNEPIQLNNKKEIKINKNKKKRKLTKCHFIDNAAELGKDDEEEEVKQLEDEDENFILEGEEYKPSIMDNDTNDNNNNNTYQLELKKKKSNKSQELDLNGFISHTEEEYDAERDNTISKSKSKKTSFDEITDTLKLNRKKTIKISEEDALTYCENILKNMVTLHEQDVKSMKENKPMTAKLQAIDEVCKILTKPKWKPYFMRLDIHHTLALWLMPIHKNTLPNYSIRTNLLKVIQQLPITMKSLSGSQLGKVMTFLHSHKNETNDNKKLIRSIMQNWMGPIIGINTNYKDSIKQRQRRIRENPEFHKKILEKAKTLIPDSICIEKEEEQNEFKRHATIPYNSECSFLINVPSSVSENTNQNVPKSKIKKLTDNLKMNKRCRKSHKVSIEGKGVAVAP